MYWNKWNDKRSIDGQIDHDEFKRLHLCEWKLDDREQKIINKMQQYYDSVEGISDGCECRRMRREFKEWAYINGYDNEDLSRARKALAGYKPKGFYF